MLRAQQAVKLSLSGGQHEGPSPDHHGDAPHGSATQYLAAEAGFRILEAGGNAVDAGVAAGIALGVVQPEYVNFAGVAPIIIYSAADNRVFTIPGLGTWPKAIERDHFKKHHGGKIPQGILRTVVPAAPDAWITALERFGTMSFGEVAQSAIGFARDGFPVYPLMSEIITEHEAEYRMYPSNIALYLPQNRPPRPGELFVQKALAATIQYMADQEAGRRGIADARPVSPRRAMRSIGVTSLRAIVKFSRRTAASCSADDLANYRSGIESRSRPRSANPGSMPAARGARGRRCCRRSTSWTAPSCASSATTPPATCTASPRR
jgi:gamma-glutamyltranspeptidase/glutathione hydrolase